MRPHSPHGSSSRGATSRARRPEKQQFAKIHSHTHDIQAWQHHEKNQNERELTQILKRPPLPDMKFQSIGNYDWDCGSSDPEVTLGPACERLDHVRLNSGCHIVYDRQASSIRAFGDAKGVRYALAQLRTTFFQIEARAAQSSCAYFLRKAVWSKVSLVDYQAPKPLRHVGHKNAAIYKSPRGRDLQKRLSDMQEFIRVADSVKHEIMRALHKLKYHQDSIRFHVRLGTLVLKRYKAAGPDSMYTLAAYESMTKEHGFSALVTEEIGCDEIEAHALQRLRASQDLLETIDPFHRTLSDVQPTYTGTLTLDMGDTYGWIQIMKTWAEESGVFQATATPSIRRFGGPTDQSKPLMQTAVTELEDGLTWQFEMSTAKMVSSYNMDANKLKQLQEFADQHLHIKDEEARNLHTTNLWVNVDSRVSGLARGKVALQQRTSWRFRIARSDYMLEVARKQDCKYVEAARGAAGKTAVVIEPRWEVIVYHQKWESNLAENANVPLGTKPDWEVNVDTWFPKDTTFGSTAEEQVSKEKEGHVQLMEKLARIQEVLRGA